MPDDRVLEWLGSDSKGVPNYLHPLNLMWSDEGVEHDLQLYRQVADRLAGELEYWSAILRTANWRHCLAGCTCLLASSRREFFEELCWRFRQGSFVGPQIAVTLGLLHGVAARPFIESAMGDPVFRSHPKEAVSAHRVLLRLGVRTKQEISFEDRNDRDNAMIAEQVVAKHWEFWESRVK